MILVQIKISFYNNFDIIKQKENKLEQLKKTSSQIKHKMKNTFIVLVTMVLFCRSVNSIYFGVSARQFCFQLQQQPGKVIKFSYEVTGQSPQQTSVEIVPNDTSKRQTLSGPSNKADIQGDYETSICFISTDGKYKSISLDFYTHDKSHLMELAKKSQIYELHTKLIEVGQNLKEISKNQMFEQQRQIIHSQIIVGHQNTIKYFALGKLAVIIIVTVGQLYLLKSMLDKSGKGYMPV